MRVVATAVLAVLLLAWSVATLLIDHEAAPLRALAERLEAGAGKDRDPSHFSRAEQQVSDNAWWCSREIVQSNVTIRLAVVDASYRGGDPSERVGALSKARETLGNGLRCFPRDGNLWLRLAMVEHAQGAPDERVRILLKASYAVAPSEAWIVAPRIAFAARLRGAGLPAVDDLLRADVHTFVNYGRLPEVVEMYVHADEALREELLAGFDTLEAGRLTALERAIASKLPEQASR